MRIFLLAVLFFSSTLLCSAQSQRLGPDVAVIKIQVGKDKKNLKEVTIGFYDNMAPHTVANFKELVEKNFYKGIRFHRLIASTLVQVGDPLARVGLFAPKVPMRAGTGGPGYTLPAEIRSKITRGSLAMARLPDTVNPTRASNGSQFFVLLNPSPALEGRYTVFGEVLAGLEILDKISASGTDTNDFPLQNIIIRSIVIAPRLSAATPPR